ncbi:hypothetical protein OC834_004622 [Tilletia horrida]|nr:hypothetical protein OC834_004622 [Tilletia horrida]
MEVMKQMADAVRAREPLLEHVFGFVDGLNVRTYQPSNLDEQNAYYNGWLGDTYCSQVIVSLANGEIAWVSYNNPGSWHDAKIAGSLYSLLLDPVLTAPPFSILADSAFPTGTADVADRILSKPKDNVVAKEKDGNVSFAGRRSSGNARQPNAECKPCKGPSAASTPTFPPTRASTLS